MVAGGPLAQPAPDCGFGYGTVLAGTSQLSTRSASGRKPEHSRSRRWTPSGPASTNATCSMTSGGRPSRCRRNRHCTSDLPASSWFPVDSTVKSVALPNQPSNRPAMASAPTLRLLARGYPNKKIARDLHISEAALHTHLINVYGKIGVSTRSGATLFAASRGSWPGGRPHLRSRRGGVIEANWAAPHGKGSTLGKEPTHARCYTHRPVEVPPRGARP
jgi:hypothetical protein